jgi:transcriptional regulator with XRE-family HTH domain
MAPDQGDFTVFLKEFRRQLGLSQEDLAREPKAQTRASENRS